MDARIPRTFLAPGTPSAALKGFHPDLVRFWSAAPGFGDVQSRITEEWVRSKVDVLVAPRKSSRLPRKGVLPAISAYLKGGKDAGMKDAGIDLEREGSGEALSFSLLEKGYPELAAKLAVRTSAPGKPSDFLRRFVEVFLAACDQTSAETAERHVLNEMSRALPMLREAYVAETGFDHCQLARLYEVWVFENSEDDMGKALDLYVKAVGMGEQSAVLPLAELYFRSGMEEEGLAALDEGLRTFRLPKFAQALTHRHVQSGNAVLGLRYSQIFGYLSSKKGVTVLPNAKNMRFPGGLAQCRAFLVERELDSGNGAYLGKDVEDAALLYLAEELVRVSNVETSTPEEIEESDASCLALLQFGAIELSNREFALAYLGELSRHLVRQGGKDFLIEFFEEHWSPYAKVHVNRIEDEETEDLKIPKLPASYDSASSDDGDFDTDVEFGDLWSAVASHLAYFSYRFQFFGDEDVSKRAMEVGKLVSPVDDRHSSADIETTLHANAADFRERRRAFVVLSANLREWYVELRTRVAENRGETYVRHLFDAAYYPNGDELRISGAELELFLIETYFSGGEPEPEALEKYLSDLLNVGISDKEIALVSEFLFESGEFQASLDFALNAHDPANPRTFRRILQCALTAPDIAGSINEDFMKVVADLGGAAESVLAYAKAAYAENPNDPIVAGNLATAIHAYAGEPFTDALAAYDAALELGDPEAGLAAARLVAYEMKNFSEGEKRMRAAYASGDLRAVIDLANLYFQNGNTAEFYEFLSLAEGSGLPKTEDLRLRDALRRGDYGQKLEALRSLPGYFASPKRGVDSAVVDEFRTFALAEFKKAGIKTPMTFEGRFSSLVAARTLVQFPEDVPLKDRTVPNRFPMAAYYLDSLSSLFAIPSEAWALAEYFYGLSDLESQATGFIDNDGISEPFELVAWVAADVGSLLESMRDAEGYRELANKAASLLRTFMMGGSYADEIVAELDPVRPDLSKYH